MEIGYNSNIGNNLVYYNNKIVDIGSVAETKIKTENKKDRRKRAEWGEEKKRLLIIFII